MQVLVTRPQRQAKGLVSLLQKSGYVACEMPCMTIEDLDPVGGLQNLDRHQVLIFTSSNAVNSANRLWKMPWDLQDCRLLAVGEATATCLENFQMEVSEMPRAPFNSEALLTSELLKGKNLQNVAIIKGVGGRNLLHETLVKRGYKVDIYEVYRRNIPSIREEQLQTLFLNSPVDIVTITSNEMLRNLVLLAGQQYHEQLVNTPLFVTSPRAAELAMDLGFRNHVGIATAPGDRGLLDAINIWTRSS